MGPILDKTIVWPQKRELATNSTVAKSEDYKLCMRQDCKTVTAILHKDDRFQYPVLHSPLGLFISMFRMIVLLANNPSCLTQVNNSNQNGFTVPLQYMFWQIVLFYQFCQRNYIVNINSMDNLGSWAPTSGLPGLINHILKLKYLSKPIFHLGWTKLIFSC